MKPNYVLIIDKERDKALTFMFNHLLHNGLPSLLMAMKDAGLDETFFEFIAEKSDKCHERDWCEDPNCVNKQQ